MVSLMRLREKRYEMGEMKCRIVFHSDRHTPQLGIHLFFPPYKEPAQGENSAILLSSQSKKSTHGQIVRHQGTKKLLGFPWSSSPRVSRKLVEWVPERVPTPCPGAFPLSFSRPKSTRFPRFRRIASGQIQSKPDSRNPCFA